MKALVLAGGRGRRVDDRADAGNKCLLELRGRPLVEYSLANAVAAGASSVVVVVGFRAEEVRARCGTDWRGVPLQYVHQDRPHGLVHAMTCAQSALGAGDFMLFLADEVLLAPRHEEMLRFHREHGLYATCGVVRAADPDAVRKTYALICEPDSGRIHRLIEKPRQPRDTRMGTGNCILPSALFDFVERTPVHPERGEKELPDLIQCAIDAGHDVRCFDIGAGYVNVNTAADLAAAEARLGGAGG
ncbi:MAG TPA: sugar phosphate nucleotidyltransferase [Planctomycetota bacterium]